MVTSGPRPAVGTERGRLSSDVGDVTLPWIQTSGLGPAACTKQRVREGTGDGDVTLPWLQVVPGRQHVLSEGCHEGSSDGEVTLPWLQVVPDQKRGRDLMD